MKKIALLMLIILSIFLVACENITIEEEKKEETSQMQVKKEFSKEGALSVHFIDVGQGDSTLVITPDHETMLIDAGNNGVGKEIESYLKGHGINKIDVLVGTHPDADHIGGIDYIIYNFEIGSFYMPKKSHTTETFKDVLIAAKKKGLKIKEAKYGVNFNLGKSVVCEILNPMRSYGEDNNLWSIVIKATYKNKSFLFTGDAEFENEKDMISSGINLESDVLKLGHHGSSSSTSENFLKAVHPDVAILSCKYKNKYGHPHKETLNLLKEYNIPLYRTDEQGSIVFYSNGDEIWSEKKPGTYDYYGEK